MCPVLLASSVFLSYRPDFLPSVLSVLSVPSFQSAPVRPSAGPRLTTERAASRLCVTNWLRCRRFCWRRRPSQGRRNVAESRQLNAIGPRHAPDRPTAAAAAATAAAVTATAATATVAAAAAAAAADAAAATVTAVCQWTRLCPSFPRAMLRR